MSGGYSDYKCENCGRIFDTSKGWGCNKLGNCGTDFCSDACYHEWEKNNPRSGCFSILILTLVVTIVLSGCLSSTESPDEKRIKDSIAAADRAMMEQMQTQNPDVIENTGSEADQTNSSDQQPRTVSNENEYIANVQLRHDGQWLYVVNGEGNDVSSMVMQGKDFIGYSSDFFVVVEGDWLYTYDINCRSIASMVIQYKTPLGVSGSTFKVKQDQWICTYDKYCKELSSRVDN